MSEVVSNHYLEDLLKTYPPQHTTSALPWLRQLRTEAVDRVSALKIPTTRDEEWRFTDISPLTEVPFQVAQTIPQLQPAEIKYHYLQEAATRLVFIDGQYASALSTINNDSGIIVGNLSTLLTSYSAEIAPHLGRYASFNDNIFAALNTAFLHDGAVIIVPKNISIAPPIHLLFIATQKEVTSYPRCLIVAEPGSHVTVVEDYIAQHEVAYVTNSVTEVSVADDAHVNHIRLQRDSHQAFHIANCTATLAHASNFQSINVALGARISRCNLNVQLASEGAECTVNGLALIKEQQLADTHTFIDHIKPNGTSRQLHKCIVDGASHAVFNGKIIVQPNAQQTDSSQTSRNLLLTGQAQVDTKPQLEIFADDVKCAHGATVGQLDPEEIFYLKSRGLSEVAARNLLTYAFGAEIIDRIPITSLKNQLEKAVLEYTQSAEP
jgi:Fe-S cluster assembly protein SufD